MADRREEGILEIKARIQADYDGDNLMGLNKLRRDPDEVLKNVPVVMILEDVDEVIKKARRGQIYPCYRMIEIILELAVNKNNGNIRELIRTLRTIVFKNGEKLVATGNMIEEHRTIGPFGYGVPDVLGMRLILGMTYLDEGP